MKILDDDILDYFKKKSNDSLKELKRDLNICDTEDEKLLNILEKLILEGYLYLDDNEKYSLLEIKNLKQGKVHFKSNGLAFVTTFDGYNINIIDESNTFNLTDRDIITVRDMIKDKNGNIYGKVDKIIKKERKQVTCEVIFENGENTLIPYNSKSLCRLNVNQRKLDKFGVGEIILVEFVQNKPYIVKSIGHKNDPDIDEVSIAYDHGFNIKFSDKYLKELDLIPDKVDFNQAIKDERIDLTDEIIFTIDCDESKDLDDSVSLTKLSNGNYRLLVNIAHVSHYIKEGSEIDKEAYLRGVSVYENDTVIPMLHPKISNGICSLHPQVERLTKTIEIIISPQGEIVDYKKYNSIIKSKKKMIYSDVNKILDENIMVSGYEEFEPMLRLMKELSDILLNRMVQDGYLNLGSSDLKASGKKSSVVISKRKPGSAEKIIETFMLIHNKVEAMDKFYRGLPYIYRVHEAPDEDDIKEFIKDLNKLGYNFKKCKNMNSNKYMQDLIESICDNEEIRDILNEILLISTMKKARYSADNIGHYGLAFPYYVHFSSPIRRYADLEDQRLDDLYENTYELNYFELESLLKEISEHCSQRSYEADKAEYDALNMRMAELMESKIGEEFTCVITRLDRFEMKVKTLEGIVGKVSYHDIDSKVIFDKDDKILKLKSINKELTVGSVITVKVKKASKKNRSINFSFSCKTLKDDYSYIKRLKN